MNVSYEGIGQWAATFACSGVSEGQAVKVSGNGTVAACAENGEASDGVVLSVARDGKACSVAMGGMVTVSYSGTAPTAGWNTLAADGKRRRDRGIRGRQELSCCGGGHRSQDRDHRTVRRERQMAYHYENLKLEKGMYGQGGRSFAQTLEALDPSESYKGTALEGLDAFQRQLKRFDIKVKGAGSDRVEKFFWYHGIRRAVPGVREPRGAPGHGGGEHPAGHHRHRHQF